MSYHAAKRSQNDVHKSNLGNVALICINRAFNKLKATRLATEILYDATKRHWNEDHKAKLRTVVLCSRSASSKLRGFQQKCPIVTLSKPQAARVATDTFFFFPFRFLLSKTHKNASWTNCPWQAQRLADLLCDTHGPRRTRPMGRSRAGSRRGVPPRQLEVVEQQAPCSHQDAWGCKSHGKNTSAQSFSSLAFKAGCPAEVAPCQYLNSRWLDNTAEGLLAAKAA